MKQWCVYIKCLIIRTALVTNNEFPTQETRVDRVSYNNLVSYTVENLSYLIFAKTKKIKAYHMSLAPEINVNHLFLIRIFITIVCKVFASPRESTHKHTIVSLDIFLPFLNLHHFINFSLQQNWLDKCMHVSLKLCALTFATFYVLKIYVLLRLF